MKKKSIGYWKLKIVGENTEAISINNREVVFYENQTYEIRRGKEIIEATGKYELIGCDKQSLEKWGLTEYANSADWDYKLQNSTGMIFLDGLREIFLYNLDVSHKFRDDCRGYISLEFFSLGNPNNNR